jgi:hypothetical protein
MPCPFFKSTGGLAKLARVPSTRPERILSFAVALLTAALAALVVVAWGDYRGAEPPSLARVPAKRLTAATVETVPDRAPAQARVTAVTEPPPRPAVTVARLTVIAVRGPCWLDVRRGGPTGQGVFVGILAQGERRTFRGKVVWVAVGAGENIDVKLNGEPVSNVPAGVSTVVARPDGVTPTAPG